MLFRSAKVPAWLWFDHTSVLSEVAQRMGCCCPADTPPHPGESGFSRIREHAEPGPHSPRAPGLWPQRCTPSAIPPSSGPVHWTLTQTPPSLSCLQPPPTYSSSEFPHIWSSPRWPQTLYLARSEHVSLRVCVHIHHAFTRAHAHTRTHTHTCMHTP